VRGYEEFGVLVAVRRGTQSGGGHVGERDSAGWYILWLKMHVWVIDDSVHVGVGTDQGRVDCRDDGLAVGAGTPPPPDRFVTVLVEKRG
jgi:hypothetical protein